MTRTTLPQPGETFAGYRLRSLIGEGGMGAVFEAESAEGERVALKLVRPEIAGDEAFRHRFEREARIASTIDHPRLVRVVDFGEDELPYMAQTFLAGGSLRERLAGAAFSPEEAATVCGQIAGALDAVHGAELVHRDIKPDNILLDGEGNAHLSDFGLAKGRAATVLTKSGHTVGSVQYMAPEQVRGDELTPAADIYGLGCVVYECACGRTPFADLNPMKAMRAHLQDDPPDPRSFAESVSEDLAFALLLALKKEPEERPKSATAYARMVSVAVRTGVGS